VWFCYVCHAKGSADSKKAPTINELAQMMEPEQKCRQYPQSYLNLFTIGGGGDYWPTRFPDWLIWWARLGQDPITAESTFPVHTAHGLFAGVGRRQTNEAVAAAKEAGTNPSRYKYPYRWSASRTMHYKGSPSGEVLVLVEGAADAASLWEVGIPAYAVYGSALHHPQIEFLKRAKPTTIVMGMDMDVAGERGVSLSWQVLNGKTMAQIKRARWPQGDPADCTPVQRVQSLVSVVGDRYLRQWSQAVATMQAAFHHDRNENQ